MKISGWSPIWEEIVDSSLWQEPYHVRVLFTSMLALKDASFVVRGGDTHKLANRIHMKEQDVIDGLAVLCAPDTRRVGPQEFDGRRVEVVEGGWLILNGEKYRNQVRLMAEQQKRARKAELMRQIRAAKKSAPAVPPPSPPLPTMKRIPG